MGTARHLSDIQPEKTSAGRGLTEEIRLFLADVESPRRNEMFEGFFGLAEVRLSSQAGGVAAAAFCGGPAAEKRWCCCVKAGRVREKR